MDSDRQLSALYAKVLVEQIAPEELEFFDEIVEASAKPPIKHKDRSLAFGIPLDSSALPIVLVAATKITLEYIWEAAKPMFQALVEEASTELKKSLSEKLKTWIRSKFKTPPPIAISAEMISNIEIRLKAICDEANLTEIESERIRHALIASLRSV